MRKWPRTVCFAMPFKFYCNLLEVKNLIVYNSNFIWIRYQVADIFSALESGATFPETNNINISFSFVNCIFSPNYCSFIPSYVKNCFCLRSLKIQWMQTCKHRKPGHCTWQINTDGKKNTLLWIRHLILDRKFWTV